MQIERETVPVKQATSVFGSSGSSQRRQEIIIFSSFELEMFRGGNIGMMYNREDFPNSDSRTVRRKLRVVYQLVGFLAQLVPCGISHGDLTGANCCLTADDIVKVIDWTHGRTPLTSLDNRISERARILNTFIAMNDIQRDDGACLALMLWRLFVAKDTEAAGAMDSDVAAFIEAQAPSNEEDNDLSQEEDALRRKVEDWGRLLMQLAMRSKYVGIMQEVQRFASGLTPMSRDAALAKSAQSEVQSLIADFCWEMGGRGYS